MRRVLSLSLLTALTVLLTSCESIPVNMFSFSGSRAAGTSAQTPAAAPNIAQAGAAVVDSSGTPIAELPDQTSNNNIAGSFESAMTQEDKNKLSRALDGGLGKSTHWTNSATGYTYTITPIRKVTIEGNPICRSFEAIATRGSNSRNKAGTACITADGDWHAVN